MKGLSPSVQDSSAGPLSSRTPMGRAEAQPRPQPAWLPTVGVDATSAPQATGLSCHLGQTEDSCPFVCWTPGQVSNLSGWTPGSLTIALAMEGLAHGHK